MSYVRVDHRKGAIVYVDTRLGGMRGKACPTLTFTGPALAQWWAAEPTPRDDADMADAMASAARMGIEVCADKLRAITVQPADEIIIDNPELCAEISFHGLHFRDPSDPAHVYLAPVFRHREACRRVHKWARSLAADTLAAFTFEAFYDAVTSLLGREPGYMRETPVGEYSDECPF